MELFPKQSDLHLEESGPKKQSELVEELGLEAYAMSRLLAKLELHSYIIRRREGTDKIVSLSSAGWSFHQDEGDAMRREAE